MIHVRHDRIACTSKTASYLFVRLSLLPGTIPNYSAAAIIRAVISFGPRNIATFRRSHKSLRRARPFADINKRRDSRTGHQSQQPLLGCHRVYHTRGPRHGPGVTRRRRRVKESYNSAILFFARNDRWQLGQLMAEWMVDGSRHSLGARLPPPSSPPCAAGVKKGQPTIVLGSSFIFYQLRPARHCSSLVVVYQTADRTKTPPPDARRRPLVPGSSQLHSSLVRSARIACSWEAVLEARTPGGGWSSGL